MHTRRHRSAPPRRLAAGLALLLGAAACDRDPAQLAQEINEARAGCTEEKLRAADEECVAMMERYAGMGTEVMQNYIGAVKALDRALQRMPPAQLDTTGLGHALSTPLESAAAAPSFSRGYAPDPSGAYAAQPRHGWQGWEQQGQPGGERRTVQGYGEPQGYDYPQGYGAREMDPRRGYPDPRDPRDADAWEEEAWQRAREYDDREGYQPRGGYGDPRWEARDPRGGWHAPDPRAPGARQDVRDRERFPREPGWRGGGAPGPRVAPQDPARGTLRAPAERLWRPWLDQDDRDGYRTPGGERYYPDVIPDSSGWRPVSRPRPPR